MKSLTLVIPDVVYEQALKRAAATGVDVPAFCANILADALIVLPPTPPSPAPATRSTAGDLSRLHTRAADAPSSPQAFDVRKEFEGFPSGSVRMAQRFVDEALKLPKVRAFRNRRGIGFDPNFVFIEYLMSRGGIGGIGVSFYGEPDRHQNPPAILKRGIPSYSRAKVRSDADLDSILPHIRQSYELKFGSLG